MKLNPITILIVVALCAAVFGGIVFFGMYNKTPPSGGSSPVTSGTVSRTPDILNPPESSNQNQSGTGSSTSQSGLTTQGSSGGASGHNIVIERSELPFPSLFPLPVSGSVQQPRLADSIAPQPTPTFFGIGAAPPPGLIQPPPPLSSQPSANESSSGVKISGVQQPTPAQVAAIASFSVFNASPQLRDFRTQMVKEGVIKETEFVKINNNSDMEQFVLKLVEWQARKAGSTPAQIQDALDRITKGYDQIRAGYVRR